ncbi:MAG: low molecular weight protein-tyrosine-phosphatase [Christensenellales bacterium]
MKKIMFVCHGNICRSPTAEFIMKDIVRKAGKEREYLIRSSATSDEATGCHVYYPAQKELVRRGVPCDDRRAVRLKSEDYEKYDLFIVMDDRNYVNILKCFGGRDKDGKVKKLLDFTPEGGDIADPWYTDRFDVAFDEIERGCKALFLYLEERFT